MPSAIPQWIQDLNTLLGVIGFFITVAVMWQVSSIRMSFRARARLPEIIKELEKVGTTLNSSLEGWPLRKNSARSQIKIAASLIQGALPFVSGAVRRKIVIDQKKLVLAAREFDASMYDLPDPAWDLYSDIQSVITSLKQSARNLNWE